MILKFILGKVDFAGIPLQKISRKFYAGQAKMGPFQTIDF